MAPCESVVGSGRFVARLRRRSGLASLGEDLGTLDVWPVRTRSSVDENSISPSREA